MIGINRNVYEYISGHLSGFTGFLEYNPLCVDSAVEERYSLLKGDFCHGKFKKRKSVVYRFGWLNQFKSRAPTLYLLYNRKNRKKIPNL